ncbi:putative calcium-binding protein cml30 [Nicotiana attenuata]|uniref:Calcium-binding protein cml30 n=1 Tax=Nicotiana attenuata TaxID=49451 RepID=A0A1J6JR51_NICAT|nr:putative calcium-binding protein cml30 [Nicotiana attenuata]
METIFSISATSPSLLGKKIVDDLNQFFCIILRCTILSIRNTFQDFYSCFSFLFRAILAFFVTVQKSWTRGKYHDNCNADAKNSSNSLKNSNCGHENLDNEDLQEEDVEVVIMDRLINICNQNGDKIEDIKPELAEVLSLFEEVEPSFEEIKQAFDMFDENGDGYIDASELMKIIGRMGFSEFSVEDCKKMIMAFDENKNGRIEFCEFLKLIEQSFREPQQS